MPWDDYWHHAGTLGSDKDAAREFYNQHEAQVLEYRGGKYYVGAGHFQFLARRQVLQDTLPLPSERPMGQVRALDIAINNRGYLRLCTTDWWVEHLGNTLEGWQPMRGVEMPIKMKERSQHKTGGVIQWKPVRKLLSRLHNFTFDYLYRS